MTQVVANAGFLKPLGIALTNDMAKKIIAKRLQLEGPDFAKARGWDMRDFPKRLTLIQITELKAVLFKNARK